ncbi:Mitochondrial transcription termination factor family protein, putative isoform 1 [Hibiscus syriacus]|uniref:Mitochondrial transcription termination factor family protein, putative isoform 1 n=1 Tax=Hibiscus syriacus TaxID=106335 RepID=A0A6A3BL68_HIBSY|nr:transcription termination factor MTERF8, chloroplastic-like [Hibiscus syriacus]KAE8717374.1 Mitochondrial transcription termination factor family protein, putative isoform 1 [Hibiscus syriacus]
MLSFLSERILHGRRPNNIKAFKCHNLQNNPSLPFSTTSNQQSFTVSYLVKTCGLSPESASSVSKRVSFETPSQPDSVIAFLKDREFSKTQIATIIGKMPRILSSSVEKTLLPKITFFNSKGISSSDITKLFVKNPHILRISLEKKIVPSFNFLSNLFQSDNAAFGTVNLHPRIFLYDFDSYVLPNHNILRQNGVPEVNIVKGLRRVPKAFFVAPPLFKDDVEKIKKMGFNPARFTFVKALYVLGSMSKSTWERKFDVYKKCGWSEKEILEAFKVFPLLMAFSEDKIKAVMNFLVNVMGFQALLIVKRPNLLGMSMEKRIVPRGFFLKDLVSRGLLEKKLGLKMFLISEELFLESFVYCYEEKASELLKLYNEKLNLAAGGKLKTDKS